MPFISWFRGFAFSSHQSHSNPPNAPRRPRDCHMAVGRKDPSPNGLEVSLVWWFDFDGMDGGLVGTLRISWDPPMEGRMILYYAGVLKMTPAFFWVMIPLRGGTIPETTKKQPWEIHRFQVDLIFGE